MESTVPSRVSCASLLVRLNRTRSEESEGPQPAPMYSDGIYDSTRCRPTTVEQRLFPFVLYERESVPVRDNLRGTLLLLKRAGCYVPILTSALAVLQSDFKAQQEVSL